MKAFCVKVLARTIGFGFGMKIAIDWHYNKAFARKIPYWLTALIVIAIFPLNVIYYLILKLMGKEDFLREAAQEIVYYSKEENQE